MKNIILISIALMFIVNCSKPLKIEETDDGYVISKGDYRINAQIDEDVYLEQFFVVGCGVNSSSFVDGSITGINMETTKSLKEQHGNFMMCINPGSSSAKKSVEHHLLIFEDGKFIPVLKKIDQLKKDMSNPIIEISYSNMDVTGCAINETELMVDQEKLKCLLVEDLRIVNENYTL